MPYRQVVAIRPNVTSNGSASYCAALPFGMCDLKNVRAVDRAVLRSGGSLHGKLVGQNPSIELSRSPRCGLLHD
jgi:hypothetical protein